MLTDDSRSVCYDGKNLHRMGNGAALQAVALDSVHNMLYYGDRKKVMGRSLANNITSEIMEVGYIILSLISYNSSLVLAKGFIHLDNDVLFNLTKMKYSASFICLVS